MGKSLWACPVQHPSPDFGCGVEGGRVRGLQLRTPCNFENDCSRLLIFVFSLASRILSEFATMLTEVRTQRQVGFTQKLADFIKRPRSASSGLSTHFRRFQRNRWWESNHRFSHLAVPLQMAYRRVVRMSNVWVTQEILF